MERAAHHGRHGLQSFRLGQTGGNAEQMRYRDKASQGLSLDENASPVVTDHAQVDRFIGLE
jgi:hypothetical protein